MTDGTQFETKSTWGSENDILKLEIDQISLCMDRWKTENLRQRKISKFNKKFQNFRSENKVNV